MKKITILAICVLLSSCDMEGLFGGTPEKTPVLGERYLEYFSTLLVPDYLIDKCTVLRVVCIREDGSRICFTKTYFVNTNVSVSGGYVISLITDPKNLFDKQTVTIINI